MATYIDRHAAETLLHEVRRQLLQESNVGRMDAHGARSIGHWLEDGHLYCVMQASNTDAFCQHHADHGLPCDQLHEIEALRAAPPGQPLDQAFVRAAIATFWPHAEVSQ